MFLAAVTTTVHLTGHTRAIGAAIGVVFLMGLIELVRRHRLQERYTIAWFGAALALLVAVAVPQTIEWSSEGMGIKDTNAALFALILLACLGLLLNLTVVVSRLAGETTRLAQELALERAHNEGPHGTAADVAPQD
jgi:hypothetical protein